MVWTLGRKSISCNFYNDLLGLSTSSFLVKCRLEFIRLSGFELLTLGPGDQEWVVLFLSNVLYLFYLNGGTTEWIRTTDPYHVKVVL